MMDNKLVLLGNNIACYICLGYLLSYLASCY
uniref:Uncharacterized protein n=1 Tax=Anguilla anguilla TaxID=7936 RepID=A0A0E9T449_ANGAN